LAGRDRAKIQPLADALDLPARVFSLNAVDKSAAALAGVDAVLNCAGPFSATAVPMIEACLAAKVHYLDITGEISAIEAAAARHDRAAAAGVTLVPAVGFDVVPSDCLAAMLAQRLPAPTHLQLAFTFSGSVSPGTAKTMLEGLPRGGRARIDGQIVRVPWAWKSMEVPFADGPRWAVTIPWGDVASAWYSTGIGNIETYLAMPLGQVRWLRRVRFLLPVLRLRVVQRHLRMFIGRLFAGPSAPNEASTRSSLWGRVWDAQGNSAEATLTAPGGYELTVATALASLERVLRGHVPAGFTTPARAFGPEFILAIPGVEFRSVA
jgi:short subunit dehydrogenase-like uncharacterized protein